MLFDSKHIENMRKWHRRARPFYYAMWAAPVALWIVAIILLSSDSRAVRARNLDVIPATVSRGPAALPGEPAELTYTCRRETRTVTVTPAQFARNGHSEEQILSDLQPGKSVRVAVNSACEIELLPVDQPPFLVYAVVTVIMGIFTAVWALCISFMWKTQGSMLNWLDRYFNQHEN